MSPRVFIGNRMQMSEWGDPEPRTRELCNPRFPAFVDRRDLCYPVQLMALPTGICGKPFVYRFL